MRACIRATRNPNVNYCRQSGSSSPARAADTVTAACLPYCLPYCTNCASPPEARRQIRGPMSVRSSSHLRQLYSSIPSTSLFGRSSSTWSCFVYTRQSNSITIPVETATNARVRFSPGRIYRIYKLVPALRQEPPDLLPSPRLLREGIHYFDRGVGPAFLFCETIKAFFFIHRGPEARGERRIILQELKSRIFGSSPASTKYPQSVQAAQSRPASQSVPKAACFWA